tara:strand:+ start:276 stop:497 length:222 start_codon:yes stop_codon:yes gene_type:complete
MVVASAVGILAVRDIALEVAQSFVEVAGDIAGSNLTALGKMPRSCKIVAPSHPASFAETSASLIASFRSCLAE